MTMGIRNMGRGVEKVNTASLPIDLGYPIRPHFFAMEPCFSLIPNMIVHCNDNYARTTFLLNYFVAFEEENVAKYV